MSNLFTLKDHFKESQLYLNRTVTATVIVIVLLIVLIARLSYLQIYQHDLYKTLSLNNQVRLVPITPPRGVIYDRNGVLLAENVPSYNLEITPARVKNIKETLEAIDKIIPISEVERQNFFKQLKYKRSHEGIPIHSQLTEEEVAKFSLEKHRFSGVDIVARFIRGYPLGEVISHAIGYIGPISEKDLEKIDSAQYRGSYYIGKTGLERFYERELHGHSGYQHVETDARGRLIRILNRTAPVAGSNLYLSLDSELQKVAYDALDEYKGSVVVIDPNNGEVLAFVSKPGFDPNLFVQGIDNNTYQALRNSPERPLFNRALQGQYPPGSTVKPFIALQGLELGTISPSFSMFDPGWYQLNSGGRLFRDWMYHSKQHGHGWVNLEKAMTESCDTYFYALAHKLGVRNLHDAFVRFGLGNPTHIDMFGEAAGVVPSAEWKKRVRKEDWYPGDTLNVGIGQGMILATPLQMAQATAMLAKRGQCFVPRLVRAIADARPGESLEQKLLPPKETLGLLIKKDDHWSEVIASMQKVVHASNGTAYRANQGIRYQVAGKTGTAQVFNIKQNEKYEMNKVKAHLRDHSWFIAFAPVENPEVAIAVLLENKQTKTAAHVARMVLDHYFKVEQPNLQSSSAFSPIQMDATPKVEDLKPNMNTVPLSSQVQNFSDSKLQNKLEDPLKIEEPLKINRSNEDLIYDE
jgi:penicillin-binding protein 2